MSLADTDSCGGSLKSIATNAIPSDELHGRVVAAGGSIRPPSRSTNPIPAAELQERVIALQSVPESATSALTTTSFSILTVRELDVQYPDARVVVSPPMVGGPELERISLPNETEQEVVVARQSSTKTEFGLEFGDKRQCLFYYDVGSDNIVAFNNGGREVHLLALETDGADGKFGESWRMPLYSVRPISPGYWRIASDKDGHPHKPLAELLLLRRRFSARKTGKAANTGSKRPIAATAGDAVAVKQSVELQLHANDNPMLDVRPTTKLNVKSPSVPGQELNSSSETYSISNLRDIVNRTVTMVFRGQHSEFGDTVVKVIKTREYSPERHDIIHLVRSWKREVSFLQSAMHPSIVQLFGSDGRFFTIFMEYLPFPDLSMQVERPSYLYKGSLEDATRVLSDMASALDYLGSHKILHNDIKPGNIVYDAARGAVLIDFGLATRIDGDGRHEAGGGTAYYFPPEMERRPRVRGLPSEIYSLGVTMLYLLKKIPLPELAISNWTIGRSSSAALNWMGKVQDVREKLDEKDETEKIVMRMIEDKMDDRISASEILVELVPKLE